MRLGSGLLSQLERCGLSAKLADEHAEAGEDARGFRDVKTEIARAWASRTPAGLPAADLALRWLATETAGAERIISVGESLDLVDPDTGEVLVTGRPGAVLVNPVLVVAWQAPDTFDAPEPEDDLGLVAMGLAASTIVDKAGQPFRVATVALDEGEVFPRRSHVFELTEHPALWDRIRAAASRPRIPCPGDWCGVCRQAPYCPAWTARAKTALAVVTDELPLSKNDEGDLEIPQLDLTNETVSAGMARLKLVRKACDLFEAQAKAFVRKGGRCVVDGKEYYPGSRAGRESVSVAALKELTKIADADTGEVVALKSAIAGIITTGASYEQFGWRKPKALR